MKLKQLLISTASIAALAVVPMSIVSCGNNNNNSVDQLPPVEIVMVQHLVEIVTINNLLFSILMLKVEMIW